MVADTETFENMDASEIHPRRINAKGVLTPQRREDFIFPTADGYSRIVRKRPRIPRTHSKAGTTCREVNISVETLKANRKGLNQQKQKMTLKPGKASCRFKVTSSIVITMNLEFRLYVAKEETFPIH